MKAIASLIGAAAVFLIALVALAYAMRARTPRVICAQCGHALTGESPNWKSAQTGSATCLPSRSSQVFSRHRAEDDPHPFGTGHSTPPPPPARNR